MMRCFRYLVLLLVIVSFSCQKDDKEVALQVKFYNGTGYDLQNIVNERENQIVLGNLPVNGHTDFIAFDQFGFDTGMPDEPLTGSINGEKVNNYSVFYWCGTEKIKVTEGIFELNIQMVTVDSIPYLRLTKKL